MNGNTAPALPPAVRWPASAAAQIGAIAAVLVLALAWMEPEGGAGLGFLPGLLFHGLHIGPASAVAWWCSGALLRSGPGRLGGCRTWGAQSENRPQRVDFLPGSPPHRPATGQEDGEKATAAPDLQPATPKSDSLLCSPWPWLVLAGAVAGVALGPLSLALEQVFGVVEVDADPPPAGLLGALAQEWLQVVPATALLWPAMNLLVVWRQPPAGGRPAPQPVPPGALPDPRPPGACTPAAARVDTVPPSFLDRLPASLGRDVVWLQAQEHYLSVSTTRGTHLLLQAFGPAVDDLERLGIDGMQTHRSVWVAWAHVQRLDTRARSPAVVLRDGTRVPLGRRRLQAVAAAWAARDAGADPAATIRAPAGDPS